MKAINYIITIGTVMLMSFGLFSCADADIPDCDTDASDEYVEVSLKCTGDITDMGATPMSRADGTDLYLFHVLVQEFINGMEYSMSYAHGLFNDISDVTVKLKTNDRYIVVCTMIENGANVIYSEEREDFTYYSFPFDCQLTNSFIYDADTDIEPVLIGNAVIFENGNWTYSSMPSVKRYFGVSDIYSHAVGGTLSVNLKNMTFGMNITANNFTEGTIRIWIDGEEKVSFDSGEQSKSAYFSMNDLLNAHDYPENPENHEIMAEWIDALGTSHFIDVKEVGFFPNTIKNITVNVPPSGN